MLAVKEPQAVENRRQHFPNFVDGEGALGKNLRQILFGVFHDDEEELKTSELAAAHRNESHQARMGEGGNGPPLCELGLRSGGIGRGQLDRGIRQVSRLVIAQEYTAVVGDAQ